MHRITVLVLAYPLLVRFLFFFFLLTLPCSPVTMLSLPSSPTDVWLSSPSRAYHSTTTDCDDNDNNIMQCDK